MWNLDWENLPFFVAKHIHCFLHLFLVLHNVTRYHKRGHKSLGLTRATGKQARDRRYVLYLNPTLQLTVTFLSFYLHCFLHLFLVLHNVTRTTKGVISRWV